MSREIFLSYSRTDRDTLPRLLKGLERLHHHVWMDEQLEGGQQWWDEVLRRIRASDAVIVALSPAALESAACQSEVHYAHAVGKPLLPVMISHVNPDLLPGQLAPLQIVDYTRDKEQAAFDLVVAIQGLPEPEPLPDPLPTPPEVPISYLSGLGEIIQRQALTLDEQHALVQRLRAGLQRPRDRDGVIELIRRLREREDLYAAPSRELDELYTQALTAMPPPPPPSGASEPATGSTQAAWAPPTPTPTTPSRRKSPGWAWALGGVAVLLLGGGALLVNGAGGDPPDDPSPFVPHPSVSETTGPEPTSDEPQPTSDEPSDPVAVGDECLVGEWEGTSFSLTRDDVTYTGGGGMYLTIDEYGNATYDFSMMENLIAESDVSVAELVFDGQIESRVHATSTGTFTDSVVADNSAFLVIIDGVVAGPPVSVLQGLGWTPTETYSCDETAFTVGDEPSYSYERQ